MSGGSRLSMR